MSEQKRKAIRAHVLALLKHNTSVGEEVYANRFKTLSAGHEPTILIYALQEAASLISMAPEKKLSRKLSLGIEIRAWDGQQKVPDSSLDDFLDDIAQEVETIMKANNRLLDSAASNVLKSTAFDVSVIGDRTMGALRLEYEVSYFT